MRILALADFHSSQKSLLNLQTFLKKEKFDLAVIAGDLTNRGPSAYPYMLELNDLFTKSDLPYLAVHGNNDPPEVIEYLRATSRNLHFEPKIINGFRFVGIGGWGDDLPAYDLQPAGAILVTHLPPSFSSRRNKLPSALADSPILHLAGHLHHLARTTDFGPTRVVNIPAAEFNRAAIITLPNRQVEFISLTQN